MKIRNHLLSFLFFLCAFGIASAQNCEAEFTFDGTDITIQFFDESTSDAGDPIVSWFWDFDDGTTSSEQNPIHTFPDPDKYDVSLTITTQSGCSSTITVEIETCVLNVSLNISDCDPNGNVQLQIMVSDPYDAANSINISVDGQLIPGSPFDIDDNAPVNTTYTMPGDGLQHTLSVQSEDVGTCSEIIQFSVPDCNSNCFLSSLSVSSVGGATYIVDVGDNFFAPTTTTITIGDIVEFQWVGDGHTTTSDATSGPDSWNSGEIGFGSVYPVNITNPGVHPYYCIPHGGPGGAGMSGTIVANCPPSGQFTLNINFNTTQADPAGFNLIIDGNIQPGSPFSYNGTGPQSVQAMLAGDGLQHTIEIQDVADPSCILSTNWLAPDCGAAPSCSLSVTATENGACTPSNQVPVDLSVNAINPGNSGFNILVDGTPDPGNPYLYNTSGPTNVTISVAGDGQAHTIEVVDVNDPSCSASTSITTTDCSIPCVLSNLSATTGSSTIHTVEVLDFDFAPADITITSGDIVEWIWIGAIDHTTTSDATSGPDSWDSGLLGTGATYQSPVLSTGVHPYYCIPHGAPGGVGMAGTITVQANCTNNMVSVNISFNEQGGSANGFSVLVDGNSAGNFNYDPSGTTSVAVSVPGDGQNHTITVQDADAPNCTTTTNIITPNCNASTCQISATAAETGGCNAANEVAVEVTINDVGGGASGFSIDLDGANVGNFSYSGTGTTTVTINVPGDGQNHDILVTDIDDPSCSASTAITTTDCAIPCVLSNLSGSTGSSTIHTVEVLDFDFAPADITITSGDIVEWVWVGAIDHTATSDATSGPDSWDSGLLGTGATYQSPVLSTGVHPYYCIPHGAPGGVGMAGTITVQANCTNGMVAVNLSFSEQGGGNSGYSVLVDGSIAGNFSYDPSGNNNLSIQVPGDGQQHIITIEDIENSNCTTATTIVTPDCNASTCQISATAAETSGCNAANEVAVEVTINDVGGGASGFSIELDGANVGNFSYSGNGTTTITINVPGDGQNHDILVTDIEDPSCSASTSITTTDCAIPCMLSNLSATTGSSTIHTVEVLDFDFAPADITITSGDIVEWVWVGAIDHTATSDATSGPDSWDSGLLGTGATYQSPVLSTGVHPYYCIPHGAPGGVGMAGTITVQANCTNGMVAVNLSFSEQGGGNSGYSVLVDGSIAGNFSYDPSGNNNLSIQVPGDGQQHIITIEDIENSNCTTATTIVTPDCNASTCQISATAAETGGCNAANEVPVEVTINDVGGGASGFSIDLDGANVGNFSYSGNGTTTITINVPGDGQNHDILVTDIDDPSCSASTAITTTDCAIPCVLSNLSASTGSSTIHTVEVLDFDFAPADITITSGDIVEWVWVGAIDHTATSDATSGPDSWDSGLLGTGATYQSPVLSTGVHPYYCIPHGAPGGVGMAGTITVQANCTNGMVAVNLSFSEQGGGNSGYSVLVDGSIAGNFSYDPSGNNNLSIQVPGDGQQHIITIEDIENSNCTTATTIVTPDCNASTCQISATAAETGGCNAANEVAVEVTINDVGGGASGFSIDLDGANVGNFSYSGNGTTTITINVPGDGQNHDILVTDIDDPSCSASTAITTTDCAIPCVLSNLSATTGSSTIHTVEVLDFDFAPADITITSGDIVEWVWVGAIDHTATSDATSGPDSWDSGLLGTGATYQSPVLSTGVHPYYCIPHGAPGGVGMAGTITVQANCTNGMVAVNLSFNEQGGGNSGYSVLVDGSIAGNFSYDPSGNNNLSIQVPGDGQQHIITIEDIENSNCTTATTIVTPDCNASTCQISASAAETGGCNAANEVPVEVTINDVGGGASGFSIQLDGANVGNFSYSGTGTTTVTINVPGDGQNHDILVTDIDDPSCSASTSITTTDCAIPCVLSNLSANTGSSTVNTVEVLDFDFAPADITITSGDIVEWVWVGAIDHTATSDATSGPDSWDSGLLGTGAAYQSPVLSTGVHPYYCIPHGAPGGVGMAGTITVQANCTNGMVAVNLSFSEQGGGNSGYSVLVDGSIAGNFSYDPSGNNNLSIQVPGDGQQHIITIEDIENSNCTTATTIVTPDCNASTCQISATAAETSGCNAAQEVSVEVTINDVGGGASGFSIQLDGANVGNFSYSGTGTTTITINVPGDGQNHDILVTDIDDPSCSASTAITTTDCAIPCVLSNLDLSVSGGTNFSTYEVEVRDFDFTPKDISIALGDTVRWLWTGIIPHTATSDATSGPNSWDSGLLDQGSTYEFVISEEGLHPYYCIPHGAPGGIGMAGTIDVGPVLPACSPNGFVSVNISFEAIGNGSNGYTVYLDGQFVGNYDYNATSTNSLTIQVVGDGGSHLIEIRDSDDPGCTIQGMIMVPDCNTTTNCDINLMAEIVDSCNANNGITIGAEINHENVGDNGFNVYVDGILYGGSPYSYNSNNLTTLDIILSGNGEERTIIVSDVDEPTCRDTTYIMVPLCGPPCEITNIEVNTAGNIHNIEVEDFEFTPTNLQITEGDSVVFLWTGVIPHTSTSDATSGVSSWDSGLLGQGAIYSLVLDEVGNHPYYCVPHGGPGGIGMAGNIEVLPDCEDGMANISVSFITTNGSPSGYQVFLDGNLIAGPIPYDDPTGSNSTTLSIPGDNENHLITIQDLETTFCAATATFTAPECEILCEIQNLQAVTGEEVLHTVEVKDFEFEPLNLNVYTGETVQFVWTGQIPHTTTSDATSGPDSWDSGLLGQGAVYEVSIQNEGSHPYYCIPHGGPGGIGMAGSVEAANNCENGQVNVQIQFFITNGSDGGYNLFVDGDIVPGSPFPYDNPAGMNSLNVLLSGDGQQHFITIQDTETNFCAATTSLILPDCSAPCTIENLNIEFSSPVTHSVEVKDFEFTPKNLNISLGDTVEFVWTGAIPHTTTSDANTGANSWDSGLLGQGATFDLLLTEAGDHPYYCAPHGGPGGIGMAGTIIVDDIECEDGQVSANLSFEHNNVSSTGYNLYLDGILQNNELLIYDLGSQTSISVSVPGDGLLHEIIIADADDISCADTLSFTTQNCNTNCQIQADILQTGNCNSNDSIPYQLIVNSTNTGDQFSVMINGTAAEGSPFDYDSTGVSTIDLMLAGDSSMIVIKVFDQDSTGCYDELSIITPDCSPDCVLTAIANQTSNCNEEELVTYQTSITGENLGTSGVHLWINNILYEGSPFAYDQDTTYINFDLTGDGSIYEIILQDLENPDCTDTLQITSPDCSEICALGEPEIEFNTPRVHTVEVLDFVFSPVDVQVETGDLIRWEWTGVVPHTVTSDVISGPDAFNSGLLGQGSVFEHTIQEAGTHPYYCIPHGAPGGIGMAGTITANEVCEDGLINLTITFTSQNSGISGYNVYLDGTLTAESPYDYEENGNNSLFLVLSGDGENHTLLIEDVAIPSCTVTTEFAVPDCSDPCFGFIADFETLIDHPNLAITVNSTTENATEWSWTFGDETTGVGETASHTYEEEGYYEICLTVSDDEGCSSVICDSIFIGEYTCNPAFSFVGEGLQYQFTDNSVTTDSITGWSWHLSDGTQLSTIQHPIINFDTLGIYEVCLTIEAGDCLEDTCITLDLSDPCLTFIPDFSFAIDTNTLSAQFTDLSGGNPDSWLWGFGDGNTSAEQNPLYFYQQAGSYNVCLLIQNEEPECSEALCQLIDLGITSTQQISQINQPLIIYPNPSAQNQHQWAIEGILLIDYNQKLNLQMRNAAGQLVYTEQLSGKETIWIDTRRPLSAGLYFLEVRSQNAVYRAKLLIQ